VRRAVLGVAVALLLSGCMSGSSDENNESPSAASPGPSYQRYVALGDSFTAAPYVPVTDLANGCLRSNGNYPALVADRLDVETLVDVSCSGADTTDLVEPQNTFRDATVPPQLDAVTGDTDLVTLGIGGNDLRLFATLLRTCTQLRAVDPDGTPCGDSLDAQGTDLDDQVDQIGDRVAGALEEIHQRAPEATVLLVGYPRLTPDTGTCPRLLPLARGDYVLAGNVARSLSDAMSRAAKDQDVGFIDVYDASRGHDICSDAPWVNGRVTDQDAALAFHPFASQMRAVADLIVARLGPVSRPSP
jgi:lysophospholipase L1-like esterase